MKRLKWILGGALAVSASGCQAQADGNPAQQQRQLRAVPGCEGCEAAWERDPDALKPRISLAGKDEPGKPLLIRGTVLRADGSTPAAGVVLYVYQTNAAGLYANGNNESEWSRRHGRLRGWLKTGADGRFEIRTIKPGQYPDRADPAHVHFTVLELGRDPYWIDDIVFSGEPGVDAEYRSERENRGGPGIITLRRAGDGSLLGERNIILER
jgi:protocatechuate 3,4-dioxygenase beta subunit